MDINTLLKIATKGAMERPLKLSSTELARDLGVSQQTAARRLKSLENEGLLTREMLSRGQTVRITQSGKELLGKINNELSTVFGKERAPLTICGVVNSGMGEGEYYMSREGYRKQFKSKLGFEPYKGTLNIKIKNAEDLKTRQLLTELPGINIDGFKEGGRTFGSVKSFHAEIEGTKGAVVMPTRTHHASDTLEVISREKIRDALEVKDGDRVCVKIRFG